MEVHPDVDAEQDRAWLLVHRPGDLAHDRGAKLVQFTGQLRRVHATISSEE
jgi:hypothetical protein